jgi:hypothetical protein
MNRLEVNVKRKLASRLPGNLAAYCKTSSAMQLKSRKFHWLFEDVLSTSSNRCVGVGLSRPPRWATEPSCIVEPEIREKPTQ